MTTMAEVRETYEIHEKLGEGGGGIIFKGYHKRLRTPVVFKQIKNPNVSINHHEVDILKKLTNSYLPKVYDFLEITENGRTEYYTVMDYIEGSSLSDLLKQGKSFKEEQIILWGIQLANALSYLHKQRPPIIHCDVKPGNIIVRPDGDVCLIDFNIAYNLNSNAVMGYSKGYASPEQIQAIQARKSGLGGLQALDARTDIYGLGATLYHLITLQKPEDDPDLTLLESKASMELALIIEKCLKKKKEDRFDSAGDVQKALYNIASGENVYRKMVRHHKQVRNMILASLGFSVLLLCFSVFLIFREGNNEYNTYVEQERAARTAGDYTSLDEYYRKAIAQDESKIDAYYEKALGLYEQGSYEECANFINQSVLSNSKVSQAGEVFSDTLYLLAKSYYRLNDYSASVQVYNDLMQRKDLQPAYYRDFAIALAYDNDIARAQDIAYQAKEAGLMDDQLQLVNGIIAYKSGNKSEAKSYLNEVLSTSSDDEVKTDAYIMLADWDIEDNDLSAARNTLLKARKDILNSNLRMILEKLAQVDIDLANSGNQNSYRKEAISIFEEIINKGWGTYQTYNNLVVLYQKMGDTTAAIRVLNTMEKEYGKDYNTYKRHAILEYDIQAKKTASTRDYSYFETYYRQAVKAYDTSLNDAEMDVLDEMYRNVKEGGWL